MTYPTFTLPFATWLLVSVPVVTMYAFGPRFLTEGLTAGAVKG